MIVSLNTIFSSDYRIEKPLDKAGVEEIGRTFLNAAGKAQAAQDCLYENGAFISKTLYEKYDYLGGLLMHGIPEFRLPKDIVKQTIQKIIDLGLEVRYNQELGKNLFLNQLEMLIEAVGVCAEHPFHRGFELLVFGQAQSRVAEQQPCRLILCPLQYLHVCTQVSHVHLRQAVLA